MSSIRTDVSVANKLAGLRNDLAQKEQITPDRLEWFRGLTKVERDALCAGTDAPPEQEEPILRFISKIVLSGTKGGKIADATDVFTGRIAPRFREIGVGPEAPETKCGVYELTRDATFRQMFGSLAEDPRTLTLVQGHVVEFCRTHRDWLRSDGWGTFFLLEEAGELFIAHTYVHSDGLHVYYGPFDFDRVWRADSRHHRIVVS